MKKAILALALVMSMGATQVSWASSAPKHRYHPTTQQVDQQDAQEKAAEQQLEDALQKKPSFSLLLNAKQETSRLLKEDTEERQVRQMLIRRQRSDPQKPKHFQR